MAGRWDGELPRGGATRLEAGQVSAAFTRKLRAVAEVCRLWQMVRLDGQGQPAERLAHTIRCQYIPGECRFGDLQTCSKISKGSRFGQFQWRLSEITHVWFVISVPRLTDG